MRKSRPLSFDEVYAKVMSEYDGAQSSKTADIINARGNQALNRLEAAIKYYMFPLDKREREDAQEFFRKNNERELKKRRK